MTTPKPLNGLADDHKTRGSSSRESTGGSVSGWAKVNIHRAQFLGQLLEAQRGAHCSFLSQ